MRWIFEVFVSGFEEPIIQAVHPLIREKIGSEENPIREIEEQFASRIRLASKFRRSCRNINQNVWVFLQHPAHKGQVLAALAHMGADKGGSRVSLEDAVPLFEQVLFLGRNVAERPFCMRG